MILNTRAGGGIKKEDINAELLQTLDPDFIADNIAEGVDLFGLVGTRPEGAKVATGTATMSNHAITVSGLDFTPTHVALLKHNTSTSALHASFDGTGYGLNNSSKPTSGSVSCSKTSGGFTVTASSFYPSGAYRWIAWAE